MKYALCSSASVTFSLFKANFHTRMYRGLKDGFFKLKGRIATAFDGVVLELTAAPGRAARSLRSLRSLHGAATYCAVAAG